MANLAWRGNFKGPEEIVAAAAPQALTDVWVDLGVEQFVAGARWVALWAELDINDSQNARVRVLAKHAPAAESDEYVVPIRTISAAVVAVEDEFFEFNVDADQEMVLSWQLDSAVHTVQFQVQAGTVGAAAGQIDSAFVTTGR